MLKHSFFKFLLVGVLNTIVGLSFMYLALWLFQWNYWASTFFGNSIGAVVSFFLNKNFTFQSENPIASSMVRFVFVILTCYFLSYKLGLVLVETVLTNYPIVPFKFVDEISILLGSGLYTITNYFGQRLFVFAK